MTLHARVLSLIMAVTCVAAVLGCVGSIIGIRGLIEKHTMDELSAIAEINHGRIEESVQRYLDVSQAIALEPSISEIAASTLSAVRAQEILNNIRLHVRVVQNVMVQDADGRVVATTLRGEDARDQGQISYLHRTEREPFLDDIIKDRSNAIHVRVVAPIWTGPHRIGTLVILASAEPILATTENRVGLGETGEVILVKKGANGDAVFLTPLRFDAGAALRRSIPRERTNVGATLAMEKRVGLYTSGVLDYRDKPVIAAIHFIDVLDWGLLVKVDQEEALAPIREMIVLTVSIAIGIVAILLLLTSITIRTATDPIKEMSRAVNAFRKGDFSKRIVIKRQDEIGVLAGAFNRMAADLTELYASLEERVGDRTGQLQRTVKRLERANATIVSERAKDDALLASIGDGMIAVDEPGEVIRINQRALQMLGTRETEVIGRPVDEIWRIEEEQAKPVRTNAKVLRGFFSAGQLNHRPGLSLVREDGTRLPIVATIAPVEVDGKMVGTIGVFRDVTQERAVDHAKSEFVSIASHQLRTPLTAIRWMAEALLDGDAGKLTRKQRTHLEDIMQIGKNMDALVGALLNVSRIEMGTLSIQPQHTKLADLAAALTKELAPSIAGRHLHITTHFDPRLPMVFVDQKLIRVVMENLLTNAIKYSKDGGKIQFSIDLEGERAVIKVADSGIGIPQAQQANIFTKFFRADNASKSTEGTGLGLYIVKSVMERFGGSVWFESVESKGTTFFAALPLVGVKGQEGTKGLV